MVIDKTVISTLEPSCKDVLWVKPDENRLRFYEGGWKELSSVLGYNSINMRPYPDTEAMIKAGCINKANKFDVAATYYVYLPRITDGVPCSFIITSTIVENINVIILNPSITPPILYDEDFNWSSAGSSSGARYFLIEGYFDGSRWWISSKEYQ